MLQNLGKPFEKNGSYYNSGARSVSKHPLNEMECQVFLFIINPCKLGLYIIVKFNIKDFG